MDKNIENSENISDNLKNNENAENITTEQGIEIYSETHKIEAKPPIYMLLLEAVTEFFHDLGKSICEIIADLVSSVLLFTGRLIGFIWTKTESFREFMLLKLKYLGIILASPFLKLFGVVSRVRTDCKTANRENGLKGALPVFFGHLGIIVFGKRGLAVTAFNYAAPIISIIFLINIISYVTEIEYAVRLDVNGSFVGYIDNETVFTEAQNVFETRLNYHGSATMAQVSPTFAIEQIGYSDVMNSYRVADALLEKSGISVEYAYGVMINDVFMGAVKDNTEIIETLDEMLDEYRIGLPDEEVEFLQKIDVAQGGLYTTESIQDEKTMIRSLTQTKEEPKYYTVTDGDSPSLIADKLNVTSLELERLNPGFSDLALYTGMEVLYSAEVPTLPVSVTRTEIIERVIPFTVEYKEDDSLFEGSSKTSVDGEAGVELVTARVTLVNGVETAREEVGTEIISEPVTKVILRGTKIRPTGASTDYAEAGKFIWPVPRGNRISEYGWWNGGYPGHKGVDMGAAYGTPIYAGANGTVVHSGWYYDYGNSVIIDHGNGYRTLYAHCSSLNVRAGQVVTQGEVIAHVGATGRAFGNHVHFEVRQNGVAVNPVNYLS